MKLINSSNFLRATRKADELGYRSLASCLKKLYKEMSIPEIAELLGVSTYLLTGWLKDVKIKVRPLGKYKKYPKLTPDKRKFLKAFTNNPKVSVTKCIEGLKICGWSLPQMARAADIRESKVKNWSIQKETNKKVTLGNIREVLRQKEFECADRKNRRKKILK